MLFFRLFKSKKAFTLVETMMVVVVMFIVTLEMYMTNMVNGEIFIYNFK